MDKMQENKIKLDALLREVEAAERMLDTEITRAARENRDLDPKLLDAIDKLKKTKDLVQALSATLESINGLFVREVETINE